MDQSALTVVVPIQGGKVESLKLFLGEIGADIKGNPHVHFTDLTTTHFARWVVLDGDLNHCPSLVFESNYDGSLDEHLEDLVRHGAEGLDRIYSHCENYPTEGTKNSADFKKFMRDHARDYAAFYIAYRGQTLRAIRDNTVIRNAIQRFLDALRVSGKPPAEVFSAIRDFVQNDSETKAALSRTPPESPRKISWVAIGALGLVLLPMLLILLPLILVWVLALRIHEVRDAQEGSESAQFTKPVSAQEGVREDLQVQNQLTHIVDIKPGLFRFLTLRGVLWAINLLAKYWFNQGNLGGIPTIHFARWVILDRRRLLFFSNYDGSWENYLGDFVDRAATGLTGVWSNTGGFPKTRFLIFQGATDEQKFKKWTREQQIPTQVWYSAHTEETVRNILNNIQIRKKVERALAVPELEEWLARL